MLQDENDEKQEKLVSEIEKLLTRDELKDLLKDAGSSEPPEPPSVFGEFPCFAS